MLDLISLTLSPNRAGQPPARFFYRLAGHLLATDLPLADIVAFSAPPPARYATPSSAPTVASDTAVLTYEGPGLLGNAYRTFRCLASPSGYDLQIEGVGRFSVTADGRHIALQQSAPGAAPPLIREAALGPALVLALALRGTWSLHASAVVWQNSAVAFVGESGNGKSTLARFLASQPASGFSRLSDDLLPVVLRGGGLVAMPRFPQLKMPASAQPSVHERERLPLAGIYALSPPSPSLSEPRIEPLSQAEAALSLVRHTVASRLFAPDLLAQHLRQVSSAVSLAPVRRLSVPFGLPRLSLTCDVLLTDLSRSSP